MERLQIGQGWCWVNRGLMAPPPEYAGSSGWALRGAPPPRGSPRALPKGRIRFPNGSGMTESGRQLAATLGRIYPYRAAKQQAPCVAAADAMIPGREPGMTVEPGITGNSNYFFFRLLLAAALPRAGAFVTLPRIRRIS